MSSRTNRRRKHKRLRQLLTLQDRQRLAVANQLLANWQALARRRAKWLGARRVWELTTDPHILAMIRELDPRGKRNLLSDLRRICAEAIADVVDRRMILSSQPRVVRAAT
jgi:hypothetical protein